MANSQHAEDSPKHVKMPGDVVVTSTPDAVSSAPVVGAVVGSSVPSFAAASELLSAPYSCLILNTHRRHIALPPLYLSKKKTGIREELNAELLKFSQSLSGVPLAYDNIRIVGQQGDIFDDSGYIHLNIEANFILFQPKKGQTLLGKVNKLGVSHVGCLVHGCFNASIPKPNQVSMETWRDAGPQIDSELEFAVTALDADMAGVLLIRGRMKRTRLQELLAIGESMASVVQSTVQQPDEPDSATADQTTEPMEQPPEETPKKKKKKKKAENKEEEKDTTLDLNGTINETGDESNGNTEKKKKKKKDKCKEEELEESVTNPFSLDTTMDTTAELIGTRDETNGNVEKKKKKKKKTEIKEETLTPKKEITLELNGTINETGDESSGNTEKKKKKKKDKCKEEVEEPVTNPFFLDTTMDPTAELIRTRDETTGNVEKKKKKKKDKCVKEEPREVDISSMVVLGSDSSGYHSDKPSKKRKHQTKTESSPNFNQEFEMPSKKKIKTEKRN